MCNPDPIMQPPFLRFKCLTFAAMVLCTLATQITIPSAIAAPPQELRYNVDYQCGGETIMVGHCRKDSDEPGYPPTKPEDDFCQLYYPSRPKRGGIMAMGIELRRDVIKMLTACGARNGSSDGSRSASGRRMSGSSFCASGCSTSQLR